MQSVTPVCTHTGLGSSAFARRYLRNRVFFLLLWLLRCFSSPGSLPYVMDWRMDTWSLFMWVSPFRNLRIMGYLLLPEAYRSLSRLSSALSAKASALRSFLLGPFRYYSVNIWWLCCLVCFSSVRCFRNASFSSLSTFNVFLDVSYMQFSRYILFSDWCFISHSNTKAFLLYLNHW